MENLRQIALYYYNLGFNVLHLSPKHILNENDEYEYTLKASSYEYGHLVVKRQSLEELLSYNWDDATGVGAIMGVNNLRSIDIDGCNNEGFITTLLRALKLPDDYEWIVKTGSLNGFHIIVYSEDYSYDVPAGKNVAFSPIQKLMHIFSSLELIWKNHIVLPPSLHISGNRYNFWKGNIPSNPPKNLNIEILQNVIKDICVFNTISNFTGSYYDNFINNDYAYKRRHVSVGHTLKGLYVEPFYFFIDLETNGLPYESQNSLLYPEIIQISTLCCDSVGKRVAAANKYIRPEGWEIKPKVLEILQLDEKKVLSGINIKNPEGKPLEEIYTTMSGDIFGSYEEEIDYHMTHLFGIIDSEYEVGFLIGHNIDYDLKCLQALEERNKQRSGFEEFNYLLNNYFLWNTSKMQKICTMKSTTDFCGLTNSYGFKYPKLEELYSKLFNESLEGAHDAMRDVFNTAKCYWKLRDLKVIT